VVKLAVAADGGVENVLRVLTGLCWGSGEKDTSLYELPLAAASPARPLGEVAEGSMMDLVLKSEGAGLPFVDGENDTVLGLVAEAPRSCDSGVDDLPTRSGLVEYPSRAARLEVVSNRTW
jgi:hypothetical protein